MNQTVVLYIPLDQMTDMTEIINDIENYKLFVIDENGELIEVEFEFVDDMLVLKTEVFGVFVMLTAEQASQITGK